MPNLIQIDQINLAILSQAAPMTCLLQHHDSPRSDLPTADNVANFHLREVAATELTVDRKVEERTISQAALLIEVKSDLPNLLGFQCSFRADGAPGVPDLPLEWCVYGFRRFHAHSPKAKIGLVKNVCSPRVEIVPTRLKRWPLPLERPATTLTGAQIK